jgi:hypothetical protein
MFPKNAHSVNKEFRALGFPVRIVSGGTYYYWLDLEDNVIQDAETVLVFRANHLEISKWIELAKEVVDLSSKKF